MDNSQNIVIAFQVFCFIICASVSNTSDVSNHDLLARIEALEYQGRVQTGRMKELETKVDLQNKQRMEDMETITDYRHKAYMLEQEVLYLRKMINMNSSLDTVNSKSPRFVAAGPVGFHAIIKKPGARDLIAINEKIIFPDVLLNLGNGYQNQNGVFVAPRHGVYMFSVSIMSSYTGQVTIAVHLVKNGAVLANAYAHSDSSRHDQGSVTVLTQLMPGDQVWVSLYNPANTALWGDSCDSFMGLLVYET